MARDRPATIVSPSILAADFARLADECERIIKLGADWLHIDVMDGHFVPNLTIGAPVVASMRKNLGPKPFFDVHLMVTDPARWVEDYAKAGANMYTFHLEAVAPEQQQQQQEAGDAAAAPAAAAGPAPSSSVDPRVRALVERVRAAGMRAGIAIKPATSAEALFPYVDAGLVDMALVMTVEPGFGGQSFQAAAAGKCAALRARSAALDVQVDGGIAPGASVESAAEAGANVLVAGSAVFGAGDPGAAIAALRGAVDARAEAAAA